MIVSPFIHRLAAPMSSVSSAPFAAFVNRCQSSIPLTVVALDGASVYVDPWGSPASRPADQVVEANELRRYVLSVQNKWQGWNAGADAELQRLLDWIDDHTLVV